MLKRQAQPEPHTEIARAVERATGTEPVRGEDLLPPDLAKQYLEAKERAAKESPSLQRKV